MGKKRTHKKQYHPDRNRLIEDCKGISKFHRTGRAEAWQTFNTIFQHIFIFKCNCGADWITKFHALVDSYWYMYDCGKITRQELHDLALEYSGSDITYDEVTKEYVKSAASGNKYLNWVGTVNMAVNNEIVVLHAIQEMCAIITLHDIGWSNKAIKRFTDIFWKYMNDIYYNEFKNGEKVVLILDGRFKKETDARRCVALLQRDIDARYEVQREAIYDYLEDAE